MAKAAFRILLFFQAPTFSSFLSLSDTFVQCQLWMVGPNAFACRHEEWELAIDAPHGESLREGAAWTSRLSVECVRREKSLACDDGASFLCFLFFLSCKSMFKLRPPDICSLVQFGHMHAFISNNKYAKNWTQESNDQILKLGPCELEEVEKLFNFSRLQYHLSKKRGLLIPEVLPKKKKKSDSLLYRGKTPQQLLLFSHCLKLFICFLLITSKIMFVIF